MVIVALDKAGCNPLDVDARERDKFGYACDDEFVVNIGPGTMIEDVDGCWRVTVLPGNYKTLDNYSILSKCYF